MTSIENRPVLQPVETGMGVVGVGTENTNRELSASKKNLIRRTRSVLSSISEIRNSGNVVELMNGIRYLKYHQRLHQAASHPLSTLRVPAYHRFDQPYWQVPFQETEGKVMTARLSQNLEVWSGPLSRVEPGLRALMVDMALRVYATDLLKTSQIAANFVDEQQPKATEKKRQKLMAETQRQLEAQLLLAMIHSFRQEYVVALAFAADADTGQKHLVGSIGAVRGRTSRPLSLTRGLDGSDTEDINQVSSLPTHTALNYTPNQIGEEVAEIAEERFVEITRLNVASKILLHQLGAPYRAEISQALIYLIHEAVQQNFAGVDWEIFNTQPELHRLIRQLGLPAQIISQEDSIQPTQQVLRSIHGHYFRRTPPIPQVASVDAALVRARQFFTYQT